MGPAGTVDGPIGRFLLPIGGGSAEATWTLHFHITAMGRPYWGFGLPTTKNETLTISAFWTEFHIKTMMAISGGAFPIYP